MGLKFLSYTEILSLILEIASYEDVIALIFHIQKTVAEKYRVDLHTEVEIVGT